jgi:hypothetical protein
MVRSSGDATRSIATPATADFLDPHTILVESDNQAEHTTVSGDNIVIATGTKPARPDGVAFDDHRVPDSDPSLFSATQLDSGSGFDAGPDGYSDRHARRRDSSR